MRSARCKPFVHLFAMLVVTITTMFFSIGEAKLPVIFNFGDSNSDTGGLVAGYGGSLPLPYGRVFFGKPSGRYTDGRLVIDFLCESKNTTYLNPYMESLGSNFSNGANFAVSAAATTEVFIPFTLSVQIQQFLHFKSRSLELFSEGSRNVIYEEGFREALYMFDIGQNDLTGAYNVGLTQPQIINSRIPSILSRIEDAIKTVYEKGGGRKFWVHNTGPLGCLPEKLSIFNGKSQKLDSCGCLASFNDASRAFNSGLSKMVQKLSLEMKNITIVYNDIFAIKYDIVCNYRRYGFEHPLMACCGSGGPPYNYNDAQRCTWLGSKACSQTEGSHLISWDGIHYTEAANNIVASKILSSYYSEPHVKFESLFD